MIFDRLENISLYETILPGMKQALYFIRHTDLSALANGSHDLMAGVFANRMTYTPGNPEKYEAHRKYVDLQIVLHGEEAMEGLPLSLAGEGVPVDGDAWFYERQEPLARAVVKEGDIAIFFPSDAHRPSIGTENSPADTKKIVIKIPAKEYEKEAYLLWLMEKIAMTEIAKKAVLETLPSISDETLGSLSKRFFSGIEVEQEAAALSEAAGVPYQLYILTLYLLFSRVTLEKVMEDNLPLSVFEDSMTEFAIWEKVCEAKTGAPGLKEADWLARTLRQELHRIGRFQYEIVTMKSKLAKVGDITIPEGTAVINIHIPEGEPITKEKRIDSYKKAFAFFKDKVPLLNGNLVYTCSSWLFYPAHREFLQEGSNIVSFMDDFNMLESYEKMGDLHDMWRIYGYPEDYSDLTKLPENTGMQRAYKKHLLEKPATGGAYGFFLFDGETFRK